MNILIFGAAGFIGTNMVIRLLKDKNNIVTAVDVNKDYLKHLEELRDKGYTNLICKESNFCQDTNFDKILAGQDIIYHLVSTTVPTTSNKHVADELTANVVTSAAFFEACARNSVNKVIFISSGGTVYGKDVSCPIKEESITNPISSYGIQKLMIEKLLYLYKYTSNLDYRIVRLANPYGPYQRPNGIQGVVTTFVYNALKNGSATVYGDGSVVRDYIYIDDAIDAIFSVEKYSGVEKIFNIGSGVGTSVNQIIDDIKQVLNIDIDVNYIASRPVDVPVNILDVEKYKREIGKDIFKTKLSDGIKETASFLKNNYLGKHGEL